MMAGVTDGSRCLDESDLEGFADAATANQLYRHLDRCAKCRSFVAVAGGATPAEPHRERIAGYELREILGAGGMGIVYVAYDPRLDREVALKLFFDDEGSRAAKERIAEEARALARVSHRKVVPVHELGQGDDGLTFLVMELCSGGNLRQWLNGFDRSWREVIEAFVEAGHGLAAIHRVGLLHLDFKPENVLLASDGSFKLADFGLSRWAHSNSGRVAGTAHYIAPEYRRSGTADARADQFSFCVALDEALAKCSDKAPRRVLRALRKGADPDPGRRFASMEPLLEQLLPKNPHRFRTPLFAVAGVAVGAFAVVLGLLNTDWMSNALLYRWMVTYGVRTQLMNGDLESWGDERPDHWSLEGGAFRHYAIRRSTDVVHSGKASAWLGPIEAATGGYATADQVVAVDKLEGKRLRASIWVRTAGARERCDFWVRFRDGYSPADGRGLGGGKIYLPVDSDWQLHSKELVVPQGALVLDFGVGISGPGELWFDDATIEVLDN